MKQTKRLLLAVLCIVLVLASALAIVAACHETETGYSLTLSFDNTKGSVTVTKPAEGELYDSGEEITVTVTPAENFEVASFKVNGTDSQIPTGGGTHKFNITADTTVAVTFNAKQDTPPAETGYSLTLSFDSAKGRVTATKPAEGELYDSGEEITVTVVPGDGNEVVGFKVNGTDAELNEGVYKFSITGNTTVAVTFEAIPNYTVSASSNYPEGVTLTLSAQSVQRGEKVSLTLDVKEGYVLQSVKVGSDELSATEGKYEVVVNSKTEFVVTLAKIVTVSASADPESDGTVTLSDPTHDGHYFVGDTVTVEISPVPGKTIEFVEVNEEEIFADSEGNYSFELSEDSTVVVYFTDLRLSAEALNALSQSVKFTGSRTESANYNDFDDIEYDVELIFDYSKSAIYLQYLLDGQPQFVLLGTDLGQFNSLYDGVFGAVVHDADGYANALFLTDEDDNYLSFEDFWNPFADVSPLDFVWVEEGVWQLADKERESEFVGRLTGFDYEVDALYFFEEEGSIVGVGFMTKDMLNEDNIRYTETFELTIDADDASIPGQWLDDYTAPLGEQLKLKSALETASKATSYTLSYVATDAASDKQEGKVLVTENAVFESALNGGAFRRADGSAWSFEKNDEFVPGEALGVQFGELLADFANFPAQMLQSVGNNTFELSIIDHWCLEEALVQEGFGAAALPKLAAGITLYQALGEATTLSVTLSEEGSLSKLEFDTADGTHYVVTFSAWNETSLGFDIPDEQINGAVLPEMVGSWMNAQGNEIEVTLDGAVSGALSGTITSAEGVYTLTTSSATYTVTVEDNCLVLTDSEQNKTEYAHCNWDMYFGTFVGESDDGQRFVVEISFKGINVTIDGETTAATNVEFFQAEDDGEEFWVFEFELDGEYYSMQSFFDLESCLIYVLDIDTSDYFLITKEYEDWTGLVGTFKGTDSEGKQYELQINLADKSISLAYDGGEAQLATQAFLIGYPQKTSTGYSERTKDYQYEFVIGDHFYVAVPNGRNNSFMVFYEDGVLVAYLAKDVTPSFNSNYVGNWHGSDGETLYELAVTNDGGYNVKLKIGDAEPLQMTILGDVNSQYYIVNNATLYIIYYTNNTVSLYDSNGDLLVVLYKDGTFDYTLQGDWVSELGEYTVNITSATVKVGTSTFSNVTANEDGTYTLTSSTTTYTLTVGDGFLTLSGDSLASDVKLFHCGWAKALGNYISNGDNGQYTVDIYADRIVVKGGGLDFTVSEGIEFGIYSVTSGARPEYFGEILFVENGVEYCLQTVLATSQSGIEYKVLGMFAGDDNLCILVKYTPSDFDISQLLGTYITTNESANYQYTLDITEEGIYFEEYNSYSGSKFGEATVISVTENADGSVLLGLSILTSAGTTKTNYVRFGSDGVFVGSNATTQSYEISKLELAVPVSMRGVVLASENGEFLFMASVDQIQLNGVMASKFSVTRYGLSFVIGDMTFLLVDNKDGTFTLSSRDMSEPMELVPCMWYNFIGTWLGGNEFGKLTGEKIIVSATGVTFVDEQGVELFADEIYMGLTTQNMYAIQFELDGELYQLTQMESNFMYLDLMIETEDSGFFFRETVLDVTESYTYYLDPAEYTDGFNTVEILAAGLAISTGDAEFFTIEFTATAEYDWFFMGAAIRFDVEHEGVHYVIRVSVGGDFVLFSQDDGEESLLLKDGQKAEYPSLWLGHLKGTDEETGVPYVVELTKDGIQSVYVDFAAVDFQELHYDSQQGIELLINGEVFYLFEDNDRNPVLLNGYGIYVKLDVCEWEDYLGVYYGTLEDGTDAVLTIEANKLTVELGGTRIVKEDLTLKYSLYNGFSFSFRGVDYKLADETHNNHNKLLLTYSQKAEGGSTQQTVKFTRQGYEEEPAKPDWSDFVGDTYVAQEYNGRKFTLTFEEDKITLAIDDGEAVEGTPSLDENGKLVITFEIDGVTFTVTRPSRMFQISGDQGLENEGFEKAN